MTSAPPPPMIPNGPTSPNSNNTTMSSDNVFLPQQPPSKPGWRPAKPDPEEAIPSDSLYNGGQPGSETTWREKQFGSRPSLNGMAHWSSHGYLAKANDNSMPTSPKPGDGYVILKRQGDQMITTSINQPQSLPLNGNGQRFPAPLPQMENGDRKYYR